MQNLHTGLNARERSRITTAILLGAGLLLFLGVAWLVGMGATSTIDADIETWLHVRGSPLLIKGLTAISFLGAPTTLSAVAVAGSVVLLFRRRYDESIALAVAVVGGNLLNVGLKHLFQRGRPVFEDPILSLPTYSFPSGHAMASTVFYGLLAVCLMNNSKSRSGTWVAIGIALTMVVLVCFSRLYLGLHYVSDVLGGVAEGTAWLAVCWAGWQFARRDPARGAG